MTETTAAAADTAATSARKLPALSPAFPQLWATPSLRTQLFALVIGTVLPLSALSLINVIRDYRATQRAAQEQVLQITRSGIATVDRELFYLRAGLEVLALSPTLQAPSLAAFRAEAEQFKEHYPGNTAISVSDRSGLQIFNTRVADGAPLVRRNAQDVIGKVFETGRPVISDMHMGSISGLAVFTVDVPVMRDGKVIYDLGFSTPRAHFIDYLDQIALPDGWVATILDTQGQHVARRPAIAGAGLTSASPTLIAALATGDEVITETTSLEGKPLLTAFNRSPDSGWTFALGMPVDSIRAPALRSLLLTGGVSIVLLMVGIAFAARLGGQLIRANTNRELLVNELNHRVKNTLSSVLSIVSRSLRNAASLPDARAAIEARVMALAHTHDVLTNQNWDYADLRDIAATIMSPHADLGSNRLRIEGPSVRLEPRKAIPLALVISELATNAVKYGALSVPGGGVRIKWVVDNARLLFEWTENGGPAPQPPSRSGYGTQFIERAVVGELHGKVELLFPPTGFVCLIDLPIGESAF